MQYSTYSEPVLTYSPGTQGKVHSIHGSTPQTFEAEFVLSSREVLFICVENSSFNLTKITAIKVEYLPQLLNIWHYFIDYIVKDNIWKHENSCNNACNKPIMTRWNLHVYYYHCENQQLYF